jgi:hypothetical protein
VRRFLPELIDLVWNRKINPGKVFDLTLPLDEVGGGLPRDGRTPRDQDAAAPVIRFALSGRLFPKSSNRRSRDETKAISGFDPNGGAGWRHRAELCRSARR